FDARRISLAGGAGAVVALLIAAAAALLPGELASAIGGLHGPSPDPIAPDRAAAVGDILAMAKDSALRTGLGCLLAAALAWTVTRRAPAAAPIVVAAVAVAQLASTTWRLYDLGDPALYTFEPSFVAPLRAYDAPLSRVITATGDESFSVKRPGLTPTEGLSVWEKETLSPDFNAPFGIPNIGPYLPGTVDRVSRVREGARRWELFSSIFDTRFMVVRASAWDRTPLRAPARVIAERRDLDLVLVDKGDARPRAYLTCVEAAQSFRDALNTLLRPGFARLPRAVMEVADPRVEPPVCVDGAAPLEGEVTVRAYAPERVELSVNARARALLVLNDAYFPGWRARVEDRPTRISPANVAARGVLVPEGE
ncbi:MAG: hypothetical protein ACK4N5_26035, partial [Myxococcales bacterium]